MLLYNKKMKEMLIQLVNNDTNYFTSFGQSVLPLLSFFKSYNSYVGNYNKALNAINLERSENHYFDEFLKEYEGKGQLVQSLLILPIQRPLRYVILFKDLLKFTPRDHPDYEKLEKCLASIQGVAEDINNKKADVESQYQTNNVISSIFLKDELRETLIKQLIVVSRRYVTEGDVHCQFAIETNNKKKNIISSALMIY